MNFDQLLNFLLPLVGALTGMAIAIIVKPKQPANLKLILAFSGAFLLGNTVFHLMPKVFTTENFSPGIWIMGGVLLQIFLEYVSQGVEHGHIHHDRINSIFPIFLWLSLCIHAFIEGIPLQDNAPLVWGILIHKVPVGMVLIFLIWNDKFKKAYAILALLVFAIMTPLGSLVTVFATPSQYVQNVITSLVIGMLLHIATTIIFESNQGHTFNLKKMLSILFGVGIAYFI